MFFCLCVATVAGILMPQRLGPQMQHFGFLFYNPYNCHFTNYDTVGPLLMRPVTLKGVNTFSHAVF